MLIESFCAAGWTAEKIPFQTRRGLIGANVVAFKPGTESGGLLIVGAHHDTVNNSPGADDNTASVAALLELARLLQPYSFRHALMLVAFDMEERNRQGSRELVRLLVPERKVLGAIVYETMAYTATAPNSQQIVQGLSFLYPQQATQMRRRQFRGDWTAVLYRQSALRIAKSFGAALADAAGPDSTMLLRDFTDLAVIGQILKRLPFSAELQRSDHLSFWEADIPAILVTDTADFRNPNYHRPTDTSDTLDYDRVAAIVQATGVAVADLASISGPQFPGFALKDSWPPHGML